MYIAMWSSDVNVPSCPREGPQPSARHGERGRSALTTPLLPEDFAGLINPLWSSTAPPAGWSRSGRRRPRGHPAHPPGRGWRGIEPASTRHRGGRDGVRHWRTYSLTSAQSPADAVSRDVQELPGGWFRLTWCTPHRSAPSCTWRTPMGFRAAGPGAEPAADGHRGERYHPVMRCCAPCRAGRCPTCPAAQRAECRRDDLP